MIVSNVMLILFWQYWQHHVNMTLSQQWMALMTKVCVLDLAHLFSNDLSLHFYNQSEINSEDNAK